MAIKSVTVLKTAHSGHSRSGFGNDKPSGLGTGDRSGDETGRRKMVAGFLNPDCKHDWVKRANAHQTLKAEGKTIWQCRTCDEMTSTYDWQTPGKKS